MRLPAGLRDQPAWIWIGTLCALAGASYLLGVAESTSVTRVLGPTWMRVWGGFLLVSGGLVVWSTFVSNRPLERMSLRFLSLGFLVYSGWILAVVPLGRAMMTVMLCVSLIGLAEIRVGVLKALLLPTPPLPPDGGGVVDP